MGGVGKRGREMGAGEGGREGEGGPAGGQAGRVAPNSMTSSGMPRLLTDSVCPASKWSVFPLATPQRNPRVPTLENTEDFAGGE